MICINGAVLTDAPLRSLTLKGGVLYGPAAHPPFAPAQFFRKTLQERATFALGPLVAQFEGTLDQFSGDGIMVFFNDPVPIPDPAERAINMSVAMRAAASQLIASWRQRGRELGFGIGIAQGYATLGQIGFAERSGYTAIGTVCNVAARLCAEAKDGQILVAQRVAVAVGETMELEEIGTLTLKGLTQPVVAFNVLEHRGGSAEIVSLPLRGRDAQ